MLVLGHILGTANLALMPSFGVCRNLVPGLSQIPKPIDAQVPYVKWCSTVGLPYLWILHPQTQKASCLSTQKVKVPNLKELTIW